MSMTNFKKYFLNKPPSFIHKRIQFINQVIFFYSIRNYFMFFIKFIAFDSYFMCN